jgi:hypothetical protein
MRHPVWTYASTCLVAMILVIAIICLSPFSPGELSAPAGSLSSISAANQTS